MKTFYSVLLFFWGILILAQENYVQINGSTNINNFKCINNTFKAPNGAYTFSGKHLPNIALKVNEFDCRHKVMTSDFQKTLSASQFPYLTIKFIAFNKTNNQYNAQVEVKMMDKSRTYNIAFSVEDGKLIGKRNVKFSDFDITPPKKMGGMIVVKDDLNLVFALSAKY